MSSHGRKQSKLLIDKRRSGGGRKTIDETPDAKGGDPTFFQSLTLQKEQEQREQSERRFRFNLAIKRQKLYQDRFRFIGNIYVRHLRKFSWAQSLQHAFEIPSSYSISLVKDNYFLPIKTFASALRYAAGYELTVAADKYFEEFIDCLWNTFDVAVVDLVDYREVLCFWSCLRANSHSSITYLVWEWFRAYDGDLLGGVTKKNFIQLMCTLCTEQSEVERVMSLINWPMLTPPIPPSYGSDLYGGTTDPYEADSDSDDESKFDCYGMGVSQYITSHDTANDHILRALSRARKERLDHSKSYREIRRGIVPKDKDLMLDNENFDSREWINKRSFGRMLGTSLALKQYLGDLWMKKLPPTLSSKHQRERLARLLERTEKRLKTIRDELQDRDSILMWENHIRKRLFGIWKAKAGDTAAFRIREEQFQKKRVIKKWFAHSAKSVLLHARVHLLQLQTIEKYKWMFFDAWKKFLLVERKRSKQKWENAKLLHVALAKEKCFLLMKRHMEEKKADVHHARYVVKSAFRHWVTSLPELSASKKLDKQRALAKKSPKSPTNVRPSMFNPQATNPDNVNFQKDEILRTEQEAIDQLHWDQLQEESLSHAELTAVEQRRRTEFEAKVLQKQELLSRQRKARRTRVADEYNVLVDRHEEKWARIYAKSRQKVMESVERQSKHDKQFKRAIKERAKEILGASSLKELYSPHSEFSPSLDQNDGTFLMTNSKTGQVINLDFASEAEGLQIAVSHLAGEKLEEKLKQIENEKEEELVELKVDYYIKRIQKWWKACLAKRQIVLDLRPRFEQFVDPYSGNISYMHIDTCLLFEQCPKALGNEPVRPLPLAWKRVDPISNQVYYELKRVRWKTFELPPQGYVMCMVCGEEFADRVCDYEHCDGWAYCYFCWHSSHPAEDLQWQHHEFRRILVERARCKAFPNQYATKIIWDPRAKYQAYSDEGYTEMLKSHPDLADALVVSF